MGIISKDSVLTAHFKEMVPAPRKRLTPISHFQELAIRNVLLLTDTSRVTVDVVNILKEHMHLKQMYVYAFLFQSKAKATSLFKKKKSSEEESNCFTPKCNDKPSTSIFAM